MRLIRSRSSGVVTLAMAAKPSRWKSVIVAGGKDTVDGGHGKHVTMFNRARAVQATRRGCRDGRGAQSSPFGACVGTGDTRVRNERAGTRLHREPCRTSGALGSPEPGAALRRQLEPRGQARGGGLERSADSRAVAEKMPRVISAAAVRARAS